VFEGKSKKTFTLEYGHWLEEMSEASRISKAELLDLLISAIYHVHTTDTVRQLIGVEGDAMKKFSLLAEEYSARTKKDVDLQYLGL
jgi:hypothetical protein